MEKRCFNKQKTSQYPIHRLLCNSIEWKFHPFGYSRRPRAGEKVLVAQWRKAPAARRGFCQVAEDESSVL